MSGDEREIKPKDCGDEKEREKTDNATPVGDAVRAAFQAPPRYMPSGSVGGEMLGGAVRPLSVMGRLYVRRKDLLKELEAVDEAIEILKANPGVEKVLHLVSRVGVL